ncbi:cation:proton antiporter [Palaeococcus ferrophilus]|uniref:cation:proton antiporter n=1 Tax=Palaeococcus ferrophilus TaxID=83868 RepID=UPI00064E9F2C|nr:cation:proton antiporter [Palaeococcus ferrophilus]
MELPLSDPFISIAIILIVSKTFGYVFTKLKQPSAMGEIVGGIIIGTSVLNLIQTTESLEFLSELGVVLLLFLAGLETDIEEFKRVGGPAFLIASGGVVIPFILGYLTTLPFTHSKMASLMMGGVLTATSVSLTASVLMEMKKLRSKEGASILAAAVVDDVLGILVLTVLVAINTTGTISLEEIGELLGEAALFFGAVLVLGIPVVKRLIRLSSRITLPESTVAFALAVVMSLAFLAEEFRIAGITGAYLAGLLIGQTDEARRISDKVTTIAYALPVPVFLVGIGIHTDIRVFYAGGASTLALIGVYALVAALGKVVGCGAGALLSSFKPKEALRVGIGMIPRMEVALIMLTVGKGEGVLTSTLFSVGVAMTIITTLVTPSLLVWSFRE